MQGCTFGDKIVGFYPSYEDGRGKKSTLLYNDGAVRGDRRSIRAILAGFASAYAVDLAAARRRSGEVAGRKNEVPLPLTPQLILVPLRACKPVAPNDVFLLCN